MSIFSKISLRRPKRTMHNLSYSLSGSIGFGDLVPIMCEKVVPGDKFIHGHEFFMRFSPFVAQVFQSFSVNVEYFFVPSRLLWNNFERFLVEDDPTLFPHPHFPSSELYDGETVMENTIIEYLGLPAGNPSWDANGVFSLQPIDGSSLNMRFDALPLAALLKIYLDYYCDENLPFNFNGESISFLDLLDSFEQNLINLNGSSYSNVLLSFYQLINNASNFDLRSIFQFFKRAYPKDYFTSALPWAQRGPIVQIPLNGEGDVNVISNNTGIRYSGVGIRATGGSPGSSDVTMEMFQYGSPDSAVLQNAGTNIYGQGPFIRDTQAGNIPASNAMGQASDANPISFKAVNINGTATITDLRTAMTVQAWLEKNARAGVRYKEQLASHFGVRSRDYRLDRAELLQSSRSSVQIGEIFTTAQNTDASFIPGLGVSTAKGSNAVKPFKHYFEEHGYVIGLMSIFPRATYSQGVRRQLLELDKFDYYWPEFQHIGEQEIFNAELYLDDENGLRNMDTFGYTPRYAHYKTRQNELHGDMLNSLNFMTASRQFANAPTLSRDFINIDPDKNHLYRIFNAVKPYGNSLPCQFDFYHNFKAIRPMDYFGSPRII